GSDEKCNWIMDNLGANGAINYETENVSARIGEPLPGGIDICFDNVGGEFWMPHWDSYDWVRGSFCVAGYLSTPIQVRRLSWKMQPT
ncbi:MAG: hypothetical protein VB949_14895, partial [Pseudomonadales bacterium]